MKKSRQWDEKSNDTGNRQHRHSTNVNMVMDNSFSSVADEWSRELKQQYKDHEHENVKQYSINNNNSNFNSINNNTRR